jgi:2,3-bisphosphoglycerate-dependent phosphoglycerate mutase
LPQLYFIRHGQSTNNTIYDEAGREHYLFHRSLDPDLTQSGVKQAELTAEAMAKPAIEDGYDPQNRMGYGITHLYCSLMVRAIKTGLAISRWTGIRLVAWPEIHETGGLFDVERQENGEPLHVGKSGPGRSFFEETFPELVIPDDLTEEGWWNQEMEHREDSFGRAGRIIARLKEMHGGTQDRVAIITHGGIFARILSSLFEVGAEKYWFLMNNCAISRLDFSDDGRFSLMYLNKVDHLPDDLIT